MQCVLSMNNAVKYFINFKEKGNEIVMTRYIFFDDNGQCC